MRSPRKVTRRKFISRSAAVAAGTVVAVKLAPGMATAAEALQSFRSRWQECFDAVWLGPEYWANPMQDWEIKDGRVTCVNAALGRNLHILTRQLGPDTGTLQMTVRLGRSNGSLGEGKGSAGFSFGIQGPLKEFRNSLLYGKGIDAGITGEGGLFIGEVRSATPGAVKLGGLNEVELRLKVEPHGQDYRATLTLLDSAGKTLGETTRDGIKPAQMTGNLALVANFGAPQGAGGGKAKAKGKAGEANNAGTGLFWFSDWQIGGSKVKAYDEQVFGPVLFTQYTLSRDVLKLTAQMPPVGGQDSTAVRLEFRRGNAWNKVAEEKIHPESRTATFRIEKWDGNKAQPYRIAYTRKFKGGKSQDYYWEGTIRRDPVDQDQLSVLDVSCNIHAAFPNHGYVANAAKLNPDFIAFTGDQFYESTAGFGVQRTPLDKAMIDYLRKWYIHGWTWRELTKDRPSISLPDDHDVYQGNLWGEAGDGRKTTQEAGGYDMAVEWVNVVHRTQTSHHPDPYDPAPCKRGTTNYYGPLTYGGLSFALLADRQYKSGPEGKVPKTDTPRGDHVKDLNFDPKTADLPGLQLLGEKQMQFLRDWVGDWKGAEMKAVISQTIFTAMATTHGAPDGMLRADYDANGWPQTPRNEALKIIRKAFAFHIAGDQHLPALIHYGVETHRDAGVGFAGPAVNVGYPRWWKPETTGRARKGGGKELTGDFTDHFGNPMTVLAFKNGAENAQDPDVLKFMENKSSGIGMVRFNKPKRQVVVECWPYLADPTKPGTQFPGWPVTIESRDNYGRQAAAYLPKLRLKSFTRPVVEVIEEKTKELLYVLRPAGDSFQPHVFSVGNYTVKVSEPESGRSKILTGQAAKITNPESVEV